MAGLRQTIDILNQKGTPAFYTDTFANRPAFGFKGRVFIASDTQAIYEDTGTSWTLIANVGVSTTPNLQSVCTAGNSYSGDAYFASSVRIGTGNVTNFGNTLVGRSSMQTSGAANFNTVVGYYALAGAGGTSPTGDNNTCIGYLTGNLQTSASGNTFIGSQAGSVITGGGQNTMVGYQCGNDSTTGSSNVGLGYGVKFSSQGYGNTNIGGYAGNSQTATNNYNNIFIGYLSGYGFTSGNQNTMIGSNQNFFSGGIFSNNVILADGAGNATYWKRSNGNININGGSDNGIDVLQVTGSIYASTQSMTGTTWSTNTTLTLATANYYYVYVGTGGNTITLPTPSGNNRIYVFINPSPVTCILSTGGGGVNFIVKGSLTPVSSITAGANTALMFIADGSFKFYQIV
jgi:hypothetical protein